MKMLVLSAGLLLGLVIWWFSNQHDTGKTPAAGKPPGPTTPPVERSAVVTGPLMTRRNAPPGPTSLPTDSAVQDVAEDRPEISVADRRAYMQVRFADQGVDAGWASTARQELNEDLARFSGKDVRVQDVECRLSLCRAELVLTTHEAGSAFMESWLRQRTWTGPGFAAHDEASPDGTPRMIMFLGRPGTELPYLE